MITGPFLPAAPSWMCAAVPATPLVLTLPAIVLSAAIANMPLPVAEVLTGGTSCSPVRLTGTSTASAAEESAARASEVNRMRGARSKNCWFIDWLLNGWYGEGKLQVGGASGTA